MSELYAAVHILLEKQHGGPSHTFAKSFSVITVKFQFEINTEINLGQCLPTSQRIAEISNSTYIINKFHMSAIFTELVPNQLGATSDRFLLWNIILLNCSQVLFSSSLSITQHYIIYSTRSAIELPLIIRK